MKVETIRLADIVLDKATQMREPERYTVYEYRQKLKAGLIPPPLIIERGTKRLVCGWHRYEMYRAEREPGTKVDCIYETYASELDLWKRAVSDNVSHGRPLDTWDKKRIILKMQELGASKAEIAGVLGVLPERVETWAGMLVVVTGTRNGQGYSESQPVKHGMEHLVGTTISEEQYDRDVVKGGTGVNVRRHAFALRRLIRNDWIDDDDGKALVELRLLYDELGVWLKERAGSTE
ncbi:MAG: hypothetical protein Q7K03_10595 [Dehalococcoidia bacterium]|nr:hypothetical protein [Dehalococcoidia bacterium]